MKVEVFFPIPGGLASQEYDADGWHVSNDRLNVWSFEKSADGETSEKRRDVAQYNSDAWHSVAFVKDDAS